jgi:hypothetical protein
MTLLGVGLIELAYWGLALVCLVTTAIIVWKVEIDV